MRKFDSYKLDFPNSRYDFYNIALKTAKNRNRGREGQRLTKGSHASVTQRIEASSVVGDLNDGEVSGETEGTIVFLTSRRTY